MPKAQISFLTVFILSLGTSFGATAKVAYTCGWTNVLQGRTFKSFSNRKSDQHAAYLPIDLLILDTLQKRLLNDQQSICATPQTQNQLWDSADFTIDLGNKKIASYIHFTHGKDGFTDFYWGFSQVVQGRNSVCYLELFQPENESEVSLVHPSNTDAVSSEAEYACETLRLDLVIKNKPRISAMQTFEKKLREAHTTYVKTAQSEDLFDLYVNQDILGDLGAQLTSISQILADSWTK